MTFLGFRISCGKLLRLCLSVLTLLAIVMSACIIWFGLFETYSPVWYGAMFVIGLSVSAGAFALVSIIFYY